MEQGYAYTEGFVDGQNDILDEILSLVDDYGSWKEALGNIETYVMAKKKEIDSL